MSLTTEALFKKFRDLQGERWDNLDGLIGMEDDIDVFLVDIANIALALWIQRKLSQLPKDGFKSFNKESK